MPPRSTGCACVRVRPSLIARAKRYLSCRTLSSIYPARRRLRSGWSLLGLSLRDHPVSVRTLASSSPLAPGTGLLGSLTRLPIVSQGATLSYRNKARRLQSRPVSPVCGREPSPNLDDSQPRGVSPSPLPIGSFPNVPVLERLSLSRTARSHPVRSPTVRL